MYNYRIQQVGRVFFLLFFLWSCAPSKQPADITGGLIPVDSEHIPEKDHSIDSVIAIYRTSLEKEMSEILAYSAHAMSRGTPEGLLNNFVADLCLDIARERYDPADNKPIDFCLLNYGGLRASLPEGPVTMANVFELMPFENEMVVLHLSAEKVLALLDYLAESPVGMPVSGIRLKVTDNQVQEVSIGGHEFNPDREYKVLTSDYLAGGGDNMTFFLDPLDYDLLGLRIRDAIILHLRDQHSKGNKIESSLDGRIRY